MSHQQYLHITINGYLVNAYQPFFSKIRNKKFLIPNGEPQRADLINGNIVLVPRLIFKILGNLSEKYTHGMADYDYSLRAKEKNIDCISTRNVVAWCDRNVDVFTYNKFSIKYKFTYLFDILTNKVIKFRFSEYIYFRKRFFNESVFYIYIKFIFYNIKQIFISSIIR
jgi:GT2 family glycosyltransferase